MCNLTNKYTKTWKGRLKKDSLPGFNNGTLIKKRGLAPKRSLVTKNNTGHFVFTGLRNKVASELRKAKTNYFLKNNEEASDSSSPLWQHINRFKQAQAP